jgi:hypothetical protein
MPTGSAAGSAATQAYKNKLQALNEGPGDIAERNAANALRAAGITPTSRTPTNPTSTIADYRSGVVNRLATNMGNQVQTPGPKPPPVRTTGTGGGGGGGGGRSGGGGGGLPVFSQAMLDWAAQLMAGGRPKGEQFNALDLPDYQGMAMRAFDPSMWNTARSALGEGYNQDIGTANTSTQNMLSFLNSNYSNPFSAGPQTTMANAPGMNAQAMGRLMQSQGVNAYENPQYQQTLNEGQQADAGLSSLFRALAGSEDVMQRNRQANAQQYGTQATDAITAARRAGDLGLNLGQGQAQSQWQQAADQRAYQDYQMQQQVAQNEAMQNWQRQNQISDTDLTNTNSYNNAVLSALLGMLPQIQTNPNLSLPTLQSLGLA